MCLSWPAFADTPHTFRFDPPPEGPGGAERVVVAGSFNGWSQDADAMRDPDGDGVFEATLQLPEGVHFYKFVVDGAWTNDPASDPELEEGDGHGGVNSAVLVGPDARKLPPPQPNHVDPRTIFHDPRRPSEASVTRDGLLRVGVRVRAGDVERAELMYGSDQAGSAAPNGGAPPASAQPLHPLGTERGLELLGTQVRVDLTRKPTDPIEYAFRFTDGSDELRHGPHRVAQPGLDPTAEAPVWPRHAVWYQVFPERFRNGDPRNDPPGVKPWTSDWWETLEGETPGPHNFYANAGNVWRRRYGGDLQGLRHKLPYLRELGVNALYLTPIFEAESAHKYDATDHRHVDDNFGVLESTDGGRMRDAASGETDDPATWGWTPSDLVFLDFLDAAHAQGFRVVIDGVFNHVGTAHFAFQDVLRRGRASRFADWFEITDWGDPATWGQQPWHEHHGRPGGIQWKAWDRDNGDLPVFRKDAALGLAEGPREHVMAVTRRWMRPVVDGVGRRGIDGWRLDVPHDVPMVFWRDWRALVKELNPEAVIIGEVWGDASPWVEDQGELEAPFDATMNYPFAMAMERFFVDRTTATQPTEFGRELTSLYMGYPLGSALAMQNLLVSHDTERLASMFRNPDRHYDQGSRLQEGARYDIAKPQAADVARLKQAVAVQYLFPGAPMTYYGDEVGMWGPDDPSNRMPMVWDDLGPYAGAGVEVNAELRAWYQRLAAVRHALPAAREGFFRVVEADDARGLLVFARELGAERTLVVVNRSDSAVEWEPVPGAEAWVNLLDESQARVVTAEDGRPRVQITSGGAAGAVQLGPYKTAVLVPEGR